MTFSGSRRVANIRYRYLFPELVGLRGVRLGQQEYYHVANMCFERVLERGRGGSILLRKYVVSHNNMKNIIMEMIKGGC